MAKLLVLHGPNLNLLGLREPEIYGFDTLESINLMLIKEAKSDELTTFQSNAEHELIQAVHNAIDNNIEGIIINPAALTHTSIALRDALAASQIPFVEVHLSNIYKREPFRQFSYFSDLALGVISGFGASGYKAALNLLTQQLESN